MGIIQLALSTFNIHEGKCVSELQINSPASMSQRAKIPIRTSPFTVHFWVSQFGLQLWLINRDEFPFGPASMTRSYREDVSIKTPEFRKCSSVDDLCIRDVI